MIWILAVITLISWVAAVRLYLSRERYKVSLETACARVRELSAVKLEMQVAQKPLTQPKAKAQDVPKRYSGAQLRRLADQANVTQPELTNSEILSEASNG
jgi:hypothetical protein